MPAVPSLPRTVLRYRRQYHEAWLCVQCLSLSKDALVFGYKLAM